MDIEFELAHFKRGSRGLFDNVVYGALERAFRKWKSRGTTVMAAVPFDCPQMPPQKPRRVFTDTPKAILQDIIETSQIELSRAYGLQLLFFAFAVYGIHMGLLQLTGIGLIGTLKGTFAMLGALFGAIF